MSMSDRVVSLKPGVIRWICRVGRRLRGLGRSCMCLLRLCLQQEAVRYRNGIRGGGRRTRVQFMPNNNILPCTARNNGTLSRPCLPATRKNLYWGAGLTSPVKNENRWAWSASCCAVAFRASMAMVADEGLQNLARPSRGK